MIKPQSQKVSLVRYFSAFANHYSGAPETVPKLLRHRAYVAALRAKGVHCHMGNFAKRDHQYRGKGYRASWRRFEEKQTDVAIGVHLLNDARLDRFSRALVVSVDTDLIPAFEMMRSEFPAKTVVCVAPPHRRHHLSLQAVVAGVETIKVSQVEKALFGADVQSGGRRIATRPAAYKPPRP